MTKYIRFFSLILLIILALAFSSSCIQVVNDTPSGPTQPQTSPTSSGAGPDIRSFNASSDSIKPGDSVTLAWEVSGATKISISPEVGPVDAKGMATVKPQSTTTYLLDAQGPSGSSSKSVTVNVLIEANAPDLIVTDIFIRVKEIYFKAKNVGTAPSKGNRAYLYTNGIKEISGDTYVDPLAPGEEKTLVFGKFQWETPPGYDTLTLAPPKSLQYEIKVCVDVENIISEISESNNCKSMIIGLKFLYSFYEKAHMATWVTGKGKLSWPLPEDNLTGSAFTIAGKVLEDNQAHSRILATYPERVTGGWINGVYADFYDDELRRPTSRLLSMPRHCKFTAQVGLTREAPDDAKVRFIFMLMEQGTTPIYTREIIATKDGKLDIFDEDLSAMADVNCTLVLRVESQSGPGSALAVWLDPLITQEW